MADTGAAGGLRFTDEDFHWITRELPANHRPPSPTTMIGPMKIGIRWQGDLDLDLNVAPVIRERPGPIGPGPGNTLGGVQPGDPGDQH